MIKLLRKHKKKALAVFTVGLMISFAATIGPNGPSNRRNESVAGTVKGKPIYLSELESGRREWQALRRLVVSGRPDPQTGRYVSVAEAQLGMDVVPAFDAKPELFPLLVREARDAGLRVNKDEIESIIANYRPPQGEDADHESLERALEDLLLVRDNVMRLVSTVKVSAPQRERVLAKGLQTIQLKVVELSAADFASKAPAPTTQQVEEQFKAYADVTPGQPSLNNPFGFGYRLPDRVKVQYLTIDRTEVEKTVEASKTPYQWEVEGRLYYLKHKNEYPVATSQPTTTTAPTGIASTQPATGPAFKSYEMVRDDVLRSAREPMVDKLTFEVQNKIVSTLSADWRAFSQKVAAQASSTTAPDAIAAGGDYPSYDYLKRLTDSIRTQTGVNVFVADYGREHSESDLRLLGGISQAYDDIRSAQGVDFSTIAMEKARTYLARADKGTPGGLAQLMQPAQPLMDFKRNVYIFRLTGAQLAEKAPGLDVVRDKVEADLKRRAGYEMATATAEEQLLPAAKSGALPAAAMSMGKGVLTTEEFSTDPINRRPPNIGASIILSNSGLLDFADDAFALLSDYNATTNPNPIKLIRIPQDAKVYVAQLVKVTPQWEDRSFYSASMSATAVMRIVLARDLRHDWFNPDAVMQRLDYKPENQKNTGG